MDRGVVPPCLELGGGPEHRLLTWAGRHTGRKGLVPLEKGEARQHLEDSGYIERDESSERFRVVRPCTCSGGNPPTPASRLRREDMLSRSDGIADPDTFPIYGAGSVVASGVKSESAQKSGTTMYLAKYFFPQVVRAAGIVTLDSNVHGLAHHLNRWKTGGIDLETMELMMEEFARHPEWCRRSRKPPWRLFVAKADELLSAVTYRQKKDPANRRWSTDRDDTYWFGHTLAVNSPA